MRAANPLGDVLASKFARRDNSESLIVCDYGRQIMRDTPSGKCTIAIIEDDASFRCAVERLLSAFGFVVHTFASAEEFLKNAVPTSHACLVIDIHLPGMLGIDLIDHLAASGTPPPAIFITAQEDDNLRQRASLIPNSVYLRKPFACKSLLEAVCSHLKSSSSGEESSET
jgi:FixJ family two-component response regulator